MDRPSTARRLITRRSRCEQAFPILRAVTARLTPPEVAGYHSDGRCGRACLVPTNVPAPRSGPAASREDVMDRRRFVAGSVATAAALATRNAQAQEVYPSRAITFINPFPPGGAVDVVARPLAAVLEPILKQPAVIETKAGAAGQVGAQFAAAAKPDGYTLLMHIVSISGFAEVDRLFGRPVKFTNADFIPIARFIADPCVLIVNDQQPHKTLKDFVDDAKKRPDGLIFSSSGLYGALH